MKDSPALRLLGLRLGSSRNMWRPMLLPAVVALVFTTFYTVLCGFSLSADQSALRDLGRADHRLSVGDSPGGALTTPRNVTDLLAELGEVGASPAWTRLQSFDVRPDGIPRSQTTGKSRIVNYIEGNDLEGLFPGVRSLAEGSWPKRSGEVAITPELRDRLRSADSLSAGETPSFTAFSGLVELHVTGIYEDSFAEAGYGIVGAPGTWASMPAREIKERFTGTGALLSAYWQGPASADEVAKVLADRSETDAEPADIITGLLNRSHWGDDDASLVDSASFVFTLPFVTLTLAALAVAARLLTTRGRPVIEGVVRLGMRRRRVANVLTLTAVASAVAASLMGALIGGVVGVVLRAAVLPAIVEQPVGPIRDLTPLVVTLLVACVIVVPLVLSPLYMPRIGRSRVREVAAQVPWNLIRWLTIAVLVVKSVANAARGGSDADSAGPIIAQLVAATILLVPDLVRLLTDLVPTGGARGLLTKRLMQADRGRFAVMGMLIAVSVAAPTAASTFVATTTRTEAAGNVSQVPQGQLWVDRSEGRPAATASRLVRMELKQAPVRVGATLAFTQGDPASLTGNQIGVRTVDSPEAAAALLGSVATPADLELLADGGALLTSGSSNDRSIQFQDGAKPPEDLPLEVRLVAGVANEVQGAAAGFMLTSTAQRLGVDIVPNLDVYTGVTNQQIDAAVGSVRDNGQDTHSLKYHVIPDPTTPTRDWYTALVGLLCVTALVLGALVAGHASHLRQYVSRLVNLGLAHRWTSAVGLCELAITLAGGAIMALVASVCAIAILANTSQASLILDVPWGFITTIVTTSLAIVLIIATLMLRPRRPAGALGHRRTS